MVVSEFISPGFTWHASGRDESAAVAVAVTSARDMIRMVSVVFLSENTITVYYLLPASMFP